MKPIREMLYSFMLVLIAIVAIVLFGRIGRFTPSESCLLGLFFTIVAVSLYQLWKVAFFKPFVVQIFVNFDALRDDLGLSKPDKPSDPEDEPVYEIYNYTAINASVFACYQSYTAKTAMEMNIMADRLTRSDEQYQSEIRFGSEIPCAFTPDAEFFFRPGQGGYELGFVVKHWWPEHSKQLRPQLRDLPINKWWHDSDLMACYEYIVLASLPYGYIPDHVRRWNKPAPFFPRNMRQRHWKTKLSKLDWTISEYDPGQIDHRYLVVRYYDI
jgi:hypothetical protein